MKKILLAFVLASVGICHAGIPYVTTPGGAGVSNIFTRPKIIDLSTGVYLTFTNAATPNGQAIVSDFVIGSSGAGAIIQFSANPGDGAFGQLWMNPSHDFGGPGAAYSELQIPLAHHIAIGPGYSTAGGHFQFGINLGLTAYADTYMYFQRGGPYQGPDTYAKSLTNGLAFSNPLTFRAQAWLGGSGGGNSDRYPGIVSRYLLNSGTSGIYSLDIFANANFTGGDKFHPDLSQQHVRLYDGDHQASKIGGGVFYSQTNVTISSSPQVLDFADAQTWNFTATTTAITLSTTNTLWQVLSNNTAADAYFIIRARGQTITPTYPAIWNTNGLGLPASIPPGTLLALDLKWLSPGGESNIIVKAADIKKDSTFAWDSDAVAYLARLGGVTTALSNTINNFYTSLKADGTYTNFAGGALYPFCWASAASNGQNMVSTSFTIGWNGTISTNDATGVHFNGSTGYGDTGWQQTGSNATAFVWVKVDGMTSGWVFGARTGTSKFLGIRHNGNASQMDGFVPFTSAGAFATIPCSADFGHAITITASGQPTYYYGASTPSASAPGTSTVTAGAPYNMYIGGSDYENGFSNPWGGKLTFAAFATNAISSTQAATLWSAVKTLNTALGR